VIAETLTELGSRYCMAQNYLPAIKDGDKRVLVVDGEPVPYCLARIRRVAKPVVTWRPVAVANRVR
jgi:glutathione synthase